MMTAQGTVNRMNRTTNFVNAATAPILTGILFIAVIISRAFLARIFVEFDVQTPMLTGIVRSAPFAWLVGLLFGLTVVVEVFLKNRTAKAIWRLFAILAVLVLGALYLFGMFRPMIGLGHLSGR